MLTSAFDVDEVNALIRLLHEQGVSYLMGSDRLSRKEEAINPVHLLQRLAACNYPLVENAIISLLLLHPELAFSVETALQESEPDLAENLAVVTLATLYLQQWWFFRLACALGQLPCFPEEPFPSLWEDRDLPPPSSGYGRDGFLALQSYQQRRYCVPLNFLADWQNQIEHLLAQEEAHQHQLSPDAWKALCQQIA
ncbi:MAG TPA: hypothetical protein VGF67_07380 [Ktedonobacteraceae bacterium]|jgi:hypothetical protein